MNILTAILLTAIAVTGNAADLSIGSSSLSTTGNRKATLSVSLASKGAALTVIQFDLEFDAAALNVSVTAGPAAEAAGKNVQSTALQAGHQRVLVMGMNNNAIADGVVANLQVSLKGQAQAGKTLAIRMTDPAGTNAQAEAIKISEGNGSVKVEDK